MPPGAVEAAQPTGYAARIAASVRPYAPSDREALRTFQLEHFGPGSRQADPRYFEWLFERNPHRLPGEVALWVCERDGVIVGQQARLPVAVKIGTSAGRASWGVDLMVDPEWRLKGVGPALFAAYERSSDVLLGLGVSETVYRSCIRSGWSDMGRLPTIARPLDMQACADALGKKRWLARLAPKLLAGGSARVMGAVVPRLTGCSLDRVHTFDQRVESVWASASVDYPVLVRRDFASLRWRFDQSPEANGYERYYLMQRGEVLGYAVVRFDVWRGHKVARVVDCLCPRRWRMPLLALVIDAMRGRKAVAVFIEQLIPHARESMAALGCLRVGAATRFIVKASRQSKALTDALQHAAQWFVTPADSDADLPAFHGTPASAAP